MAKRVPFIDREQELAQIDRLIKEWDTRRVLCVHGPGGIGKTRLLQEVRKRYAGSGNERPSLLVANIIDFDDRAFHFAGNVGRKIAQILDRETFEPYMRRLIDRRKMEEAGVSRERLLQESQAVDEEFVKCFNSVSSRWRVVLLLDTTDALTGTDAWDYIVGLGFELENAVLIVAGRNAKDVWKTLRPQLGEDAQLIELAPLQEEASHLYLRQKQDLLQISLDHDLAQKMLLLASGKPILIDLAVEWRSREIPLDWLVEESLQDLKALPDDEMKERQRDFERRLVHHIADTRQLMDWLILTMSRVYPLDVKMSAKLLSIPPEKAQSLFKEAQTYVFVKSLPDGRISLHDEMRRMVNEYVWPEVDPDEDRRRRDSNLAAEFLSGRVRHLDADIRRCKRYSKKIVLREEQAVLIERWLDHAVFSDISEGIKVYKEVVGKARDGNDVSLAKRLEEIVRQYRDLMNADQQYEIRVTHGRLLNDEGKAREARKVFQQLLRANQGIPEREADIYNALAVSERDLGNLDRALEYQKRSLEILKELKRVDFIPPVANQIGYIYRLRGEWQEAIRFYKRAFGAALGAGKPNPHLVASIMNNMGYTYWLGGDFEEGERNCLQALDIWSRLGSRENLGLGETTLATIFRDQGSYEEAIAYLHRAIDRFEEPDDFRGLVKAYFHLGWTLWFRGDEEKRNGSPVWRDTFISAKAAFEESLRLAREYDVKTELPGILHQSSNVHWLLGEKEEARERNDKAYELGKDIPDYRYAIDSLVGKAEYDYDEGVFDHISEYARELKEEYGSLGFRVGVPYMGCYDQANWR